MRSAFILIRLQDDVPKLTTCNMKILYSIQATGNGHISRAMELVPFLEKFGTVDLFLSGGNSTLTLDVPIKYRSQGLSLYYTCEGSLDYWKITRNISPFRVMK